MWNDKRGNIAFLRDTEIDGTKIFLNILTKVPERIHNSSEIQFREKFFEQSCKTFVLKQIKN